MALSDDEKKFITAIVAVAAASGVVYFSYRAWQQSHILDDAAHDVRRLASNAETAISGLLPGQLGAPSPTATAPPVYTTAPTHATAAHTAANHTAANHASAAYAHDAISKNAAYKQAHPREWSSAMDVLRTLGYAVPDGNPSNVAVARFISQFQGAYTSLDAPRHADWQPRRLTQDGKMGPNTLAALTNYVDYVAPIRAQETSDSMNFVQS